MTNDEKPNPDIKAPKFAICVYTFGIAGAIYQPDDSQYKYHELKLNRLLEKIEIKKNKKGGVKLKTLYKYGGTENPYWVYGVGICCLLLMLFGIIHFFITKIF